MELHKPPAGRLATVFYKAEPSNIISETSSTASDDEKGAVGEDTPPLKVETRKSASHINRAWTRDRETLAWKNVSLELKVGGEKKALLNDMNGMFLPHVLINLRVFYRYLTSAC